MKSITDALRKLRRLSSQERRLLVQAWLLLIVADLALRLLPFATVLRYCQYQNMWQERKRTDATPSASRIAWLVEKAGQGCPTETSCLTEALVLSWLLTRRGMPATLRIGVGRHAGAFTAHAWLEQDGRVILGNQGRDAYTPLLSIHQ